MQSESRNIQQNTKNQKSEVILMCNNQWTLFTGQLFLNADDDDDENDSLAC
jgi:hypothetical protein